MSRTSDTYAGVTYANGRIPARFLARVDGKHGTSRTLTAQLRADAAAALNRCMAEGEAAGLAPLRLRGWYRSLGEQVSVLLAGSTTTPNGRASRVYNGRRYYLTGGAIATPGYSNHGLGLAIDADDFGGVGQWNVPHQLAWTPYLEKHGFTDTEGRSIGEPWHRVYDPTTDRGKNTTPPRDWFTMATEKDLRRVVAAEVEEEGTRTRRYLRDYIERSATHHPQVPDEKGGKDGKISHVAALERLLILTRRNEDTLADVVTRLEKMEKRA